METKSTKGSDHVQSNRSSTFSNLEKCLEAFDKAWDQSKSPQEISDFLPEENGTHQLVLVELIKMDLEYRYVVWNFPKRLDDYVEEFPKYLGNLPADLIYEEFHLRLKSGFKVSRNEYIERYPKQKSALEGLLNLDNKYQSTLITGKPNGHLPDQIKIGSCLDDFNLIRELGYGTFARVYLALQRSLQRLVALKVTKELGLEAQTLAQLDHQSIVRIFDQRQLPHLDLALLYMQYVPGGTLRDIVNCVRATPFNQRRGQLYFDTISASMKAKGETPHFNTQTYHNLRNADWPNMVCWIGARLADGLDYAHTHKVLHRDIKPANVLIGADAIPKLADFNLSFCSNLITATPKAYFGGSIGYMSPQQLMACHPYFDGSATDLDFRTDIYSLGVVLWELVNGERPFPDGTLSNGWTELLDAMIVQRSCIQPLDNPNPDPKSESACRLLSVVNKCLAEDPNQRWSTAGELAQQLELCLHPHSWSLLFPEPKGLRKFVYAYPVFVLFAAVAIPHIAAGWFNYIYNNSEIISHLPAVFQVMFWKIQIAINSVFYPLGLGLLFTIIYPVIHTASKPHSGSPKNLKIENPLLSRCLTMGHIAAALGLTLWFLASIAYPLSLHMTAGALSTMDYPHFFGSLLICGLIGASYPFFGMTYIAVRVIYPRLINGDLALIDAIGLKQLAQQMPPYLLLSALVPMIAILILVLMGSNAKFALIVLSVVGIAGFIAMCYLFRSIQSDITALIDAAACKIEREI